MVGKPIPTPAPIPTPTPGPAPSLFPNEKLGLSTVSYNLASVISPAGKIALVPLSDSFSGIASKIAAGVGPTTAADILKETKASNTAALSTAKVDSTLWAAWNKSIGDTVYGLYSAKKINTTDDWVQAWNEIAIGLKAVK